MRTAKSKLYPTFRRLYLPAALSLMLWPAWAAAQQCNDRAEADKGVLLEPPPASSPEASAPATLAAGREQMAALSRTAVLESRIGQNRGAIRH